MGEKPVPRQNRLPRVDEQAKALRTALASQPKPVTPEQLPKTFARANLDRVEELLETLDTQPLKADRWRIGLLSERPHRAPALPNSNIRPK